MKNQDIKRWLPTLSWNQLLTGKEGKNRKQESNKIWIQGNKGKRQGSDTLVVKSC